MTVVTRKRSDGETGVFAVSGFAVGEKIGFFEGHIIPKPHSHSLCQNGIHVEGIKPLCFLNHSCIPNARFENLWLIATKDIAPQEEVTFDYSTTEPIITNPFRCVCGSPDCRGMIE